ncbi:nucleotide kinase domain-containing protein [Micromonospora tulbaghiae]|uniref:nucleotide kinase domain-containing protein n=1 Tax=Micromonospora tulbaghiae TaxID=479978 RepID=UPI0033F4E554
MAGGAVLERDLCVDVIEVAGRRLAPTAVFDTYWRFAAERQRIYEARLRGEPAPWTDDAILAHHRFTNCYRAADRVSQYLIRQVQYQGAQEWNEVFFRTLLFKIFNKPGTWDLLSSALTTISWESYSYRGYDSILSRAFDAGVRLYSPAYIIPSPPFGESRKHRNHLRLIESMMNAGVPDQLLAASSMRRAFEILRAQPGIGDFLAYQYLIDLNYSAALSFDEMEFVVPGPGARDGLRKCFGPSASGIEAEVIRYMSASQSYHFDRLGLQWQGLNGRPLQLVDCQNLFCEVDKYSRVAHPQIQGISGRTRIKQIYRADGRELSAWFPPKWGINDRI